MGKTTWPSPVADAEILAARFPREQADPWKPYGYFVEPERTARDTVEPVATLFLTNRECPFRCLMCDLWRYTTEWTVPPGAIPAQIEHALARLPATRHIKLYNGGNFFDRKAIPPDDFEAIADLLRDFETVIVENHPNLCDAACLRFRDLIDGRLEVALGLETVHPEVLPRLNKRMTLADFERAVGFLRANDIEARAFILLRPPYLSEEEGVEWALRSLETAFEAGVGCCTVVPTRSGNGIMDRLEDDGHFAPPRLDSIERVLDEGLRMQRGRVFVDLWDLERFYDCPQCGPARRERLQRMNESQVRLPAVSCSCGRA
jgi:radical SAM enzyme (TIGR01210 family)